MYNGMYIRIRHYAHNASFQCAKCGTLVDHDSNLLLLSNGKPICENCSYNCRVCDKKIDDLVRHLYLRFTDRPGNHDW